MQVLLCLLVFFVAGLIPSANGFLVVPSCSPSSSLRHSSSSSSSRTSSGSSTAAVLRAAAEKDGSAMAGSSDDVCPGYPRCSGEYRDKGCDGTGRISGGVGALLPWLPIKAYRPCPSFTEAKYRYTRQGQSLNEVVFARRQGTMSDITMDDSFGAMKDEDGAASAPSDAKEGDGSVDNKKS